MSNRPVESRARQNPTAHTHTYPPASQNKQQKRQAKKARRINRQHEERRSKSPQKEPPARFARKEIPPRDRVSLRPPPSAAIRCSFCSAFCVCCCVAGSDGSEFMVLLPLVWMNCYESLSAPLSRFVLVQVALPSWAPELQGVSVLGLEQE